MKPSQLIDSKEMDNVYDNLHVEHERLKKMNNILIERIVALGKTLQVIAEADPHGCEVCPYTLARETKENNDKFLASIHQPEETHTIPESIKLTDTVDLSGGKV